LEDVLNYALPEELIKLHSQFLGHLEPLQTKEGLGTIQPGLEKVKVEVSS